LGGNVVFVFVVILWLEIVFGDFGFFLEGDHILAFLGMILKVRESWQFRRVFVRAGKT
jgi:hypothetical protein